MLRRHVGGLDDVLDADRHAVDRRQRFSGAPARGRAVRGLLRGRRDVETHEGLHDLRLEFRDSRQGSARAGRRGVSARARIAPPPPDRVSARKPVCAREPASGGLVQSRWRRRAAGMAIMAVRSRNRFARAGSPAIRASSSKVLPALLGIARLQALLVGDGLLLHELDRDRAPLQIVEIEQAIRCAVDHDRASFSQGSPHPACRR